MSLWAIVHFRKRHGRVAAEAAVRLFKGEVICDNTAYFPALTIHAVRTLRMVGARKIHARCGEPPRFALMRDSPRGYQFLGTSSSIDWKILNKKTEPDECFMVLGN